MLSTAHCCDLLARPPVVESAGSPRLRARDLAASLVASPRLRSSNHEMFALDRSRSHPVRVLLVTLDLGSKEAAVRSY